MSERLHTTIIKFAVKIDNCLIISEAIQKLAFKAGYEWEDGAHVGTDLLEEEIYGIIFYNDGHMEFDPRIEDDILYKTVSQAIKMLQEPISAYAFAKKIIVYGENVMFDKNGNIDVGCQHIKFDLVERIYNKCLKMRGN